MSSVPFFLETLEKLGAAPVSRGATYMQLRSGTRPLRAHNLVGRSSNTELFKRNELPVKPGNARQITPEIVNSIVLPPSSMTLENTGSGFGDSGVKY